MRRPGPVVDEWRGAKNLLWADNEHLLRWGWAPGGTRVRQYFQRITGPSRPVEPWERSRWWLAAKATRCEGISKIPYFTSSGQTPQVKEFFEGAHRSHVLLSGFNHLAKESP